MKQRSTTSALLTCVLFLTACKTTPVIDFDQTAAAKIANYNSFSIIAKDTSEAEKSSILSPIVDRRVKAAITASLNSKGFNQSDENPDFKVAFDTLSKSRKELEEVFVGFPPYRSHPYYGYYRSPQFVTREYEEGTFLIDIVDTQANELIWRGIYKKDLGWEAPTNSEVNEIISLILAEFPPQLAN